MVDIYEVQSNEPVLRKMANVINKKKIKLPFGTKSVARVENIWFDQGANMMWTTLIVGEKGDSWQLLNPRVNKLLLKLSPKASDDYIETLINLIVKNDTNGDIEDIKADLNAIEYIIDAANNEVKANELMNR